MWVAEFDLLSDLTAIILGEKVQEDVRDKVELLGVS